LTGFLEKEALGFVSDLWRLLVEAQTSPDGIPAQFKQAVQQKFTQQLVSGCAHGVCIRRG
jgi:serine/arginine repetitive matrix protein 1